MTKRTIAIVHEYPILKPFRQNGRWWRIEDETIKLAKRQATFLQRSGKIGPLNAPELKRTPQLQTKKEVKNA